MENRKSKVTKLFSIPDPEVRKAAIIYQEWAIFDELIKAKNRKDRNVELLNAKKILYNETELRLEKLLDFYEIDRDNKNKFHVLAKALATDYVTNFDVYKIRWRQAGVTELDILKLENFVDNYVVNQPKPSIKLACKAAKQQFRKETIGTKSVKTLINWYFQRKDSLKKYKSYYPLS
jgi:hypothetical protein